MLNASVQLAIGLAPLVLLAIAVVVRPTPGHRRAIPESQR